MNPAPRDGRINSSSMGGFLGRLRQVVDVPFWFVIRLL
jgi:hypothetical protein